MAGTGEQRTNEPGTPAVVSDVIAGEAAAREGISPGYFAVRPAPKSRLRVLAGRGRDAVAALAWLEHRLAAGYRPEECVGTRHRGLERFIAFPRVWHPVHKQCIELFDMPDNGIRRLDELERRLQLQAEWTRAARWGQFFNDPRTNRSEPEGASHAEPA